MRFYRAESTQYFEGRTNVYFREFIAIKQTDKSILLRETSAWGEYSRPPYKRIMKGSYRQWASVSQKDALTSMIARKNRAIRIYRGKIDSAVGAITQAERLLHEMTEVSQ